MSEARRQQLADSFGAASRLYAASRPAYPVEAIRWLLGESPLRVLDLAAGTGKLTGVVRELGHEVVAVEPSDGMLAQLRAELPDVDARLGRAEQIPLPDADVDAVLIGTAVHWFQRPAADAEIARVLRPGGVAGVLYHDRDRSVPWVAAFDVLFESIRQQAGWPGESSAKLDPRRFGTPERATFSYRQPIDADGLVALVATRSYVLSSSDQAREAILDRVREFATTHPDLAGRDRFELAYLTIVDRYRLRPAA